MNLSALNLRNAASPLIADSFNTIFNPIAAKSSNANAVTAKPLATATPGVFEVGVSQLAQGQTVTGTPIGALEITGVTTSNGYGQLEFNINGNVVDVTFQLNGSETNQEAFAVVAAAINGRKTGIAASVAVNQTGNASLNLTGPTGAGNTFTVTDSLGNVAAFTGIGSPANVSKNAQNSAYTVNGASFTDTTNQPTLAVTGFQLNLLQTTGLQTVDITVGSSTDTGKTTTAINNFVSAFNTTLSTLSSGTSLQSQSGASSLSMLAAMNATNLHSIGITVGANGRLTINDAKLQDSLVNKPELVKSVFNGKWSFAIGIQTVADNLVNQSLSSTGNMNFTNYFNPVYQSPFNLNSFVASNMGLFFNSYM
jgi:flagellar hook-associated protein 2